MSESMNMIYWLSLVSNVTILITDPSSNSQVPFQKCCRRDQIVDANGMKCLPVDKNTNLSDHVNSILRPDPSIFDIFYGIPCQNHKFEVSQVSTSIISSLYYNGSVKIHLSNEKLPRVLEWKHYCIDLMELPKNLHADVKNVQFHPILLICGQWSVFTLPGPKLISLLFLPGSILLTIITLALFLAVPELHVKVKDKSLICFLACLTFMLLATALLELLLLSSTKISSKIIVVVGCASMFISIFAFSWLSVMCIHLWRSVTNFNSKSERSFGAYSLYSLGLPLIYFMMAVADYLIFGKDNFMYRCMEGGLMMNPACLYIWYVVAVQQIINFCLFGHVAYVIWNRNQQWNGNGDVVSQKHSRKQKSMVFQLFRLFLIMGLDWTCYIIGSYLRSRAYVNYPVFDYFFNLSMICPGYLIFINYICCDKRVIAVLRKRFPKIMKIFGSQKTIPVYIGENVTRS